MIVNIIRFAFRDELTETEKQRILAAITRTSKMDCVTFATVGKDMGNPADGYTHAYCAGIADLDALKNYFTDPIHREGDFIFLPAISRLFRFAITDDENPDLLEEITKIYLGVMEKDPEWRNLFSLIPELHL